MIDLRKAFDQLCRHWLAANASSAYASLSDRLFVGSEGKIESPMWLAIPNHRTSGAGRWSRISFPATTSLPWAYQDFVPSLSFRNEPVEVLRCIGEARDGDHYQGVAFINKNTPPDRVVRVANPSYGNWIVAPLWLISPAHRPDDVDSHWLECRFPPKWKELCAVRFTSYSKLNAGTVLVNPAHPIVKAQNPSTEKWIADNRAAMSDPLTLKPDILHSADNAATWLLHFILSNPHSAKIWNGLLERDETFVAELWRLIFGRAGKSASVHLWTEDSVYSNLLVVNLNGAKILPNGSDIERHLVDPGAEWSLMIEPHRRTAKSGSKP
jgi:hypothetical protein